MRDHTQLNLPGTGCPGKRLDGPYVSGTAERADAHAEVEAVLDAHAKPDYCQKANSVQKLRRLLQRYLRLIGTDAEFQAADFNTWLNTTNLAPKNVDLRCTGAIFRDLLRSGQIVTVGYRPNVGNRNTNYHSTPRAVYHVVSLSIPQGGGQ